MRRELAVFVAVAVLVACGSFGEDTANDDASGSEKDAGPSTTKPKVDGGAADVSSADAGGTCETVIEQPFAGPAVAGWTSSTNGAELAFVAGPNGLPSLRVEGISPASNVPIKGYFERTVPYAMASAHAEFEVAYDFADPTASYGCVLNLTRTTLFGEARRALARTNEGHFAAGGFFDTAATNTELVPFTEVPAATWVHVTLDLELANDGAVERRASYNGADVALTRFQPPGAAPFDAIHVLCGLTTAAGPGSQERIYVKDLRVTACKKP